MQDFIHGSLSSPSFLYMNGRCISTTKARKGAYCLNIVIYRKKKILYSAWLSFVDIYYTSLIIKIIKLITKILKYFFFLLKLSIR